MSKNCHKQLTFQVDLPLSSQFSSFFALSNQQACDALQNWIEKDLYENCFFIWGNEGVGRTHLLKACCHLAHQKNLKIVYLPLKSMYPLSLEMWNGLENYEVIVIDDLDVFVGEAAHEQCLFNLYEIAVHNQIRLLFSASRSPFHLNFCLPDLRSRLSMAVIYHIHSLNDNELIRALCLQAKQRGLTFKREVAHYLIHHFSRNMKPLIEILEFLSKMALQNKRRLTIPFIKTVLKND